MFVRLMSPGDQTNSSLHSDRRLVMRTTENLKVNEVRSVDRRSEKDLEQGSE
jgi:hypothetical protein